ncbi:hypothetical protein JTE90_007411 [Oedothorax gibbosus]|uniref:DNA repair protein complementing XP-G cells n=1 Tax=Oedothorax gibbosus TaxID=931172 RepID=A0AAV6UJM3_9ARAC|nr:hypothetical protein JTE90_007411 [Oedothorax gibbosus]
MGVLGLWQLLAPVGQPVALESLENKIFAVDISIWLNQAIKGYRDSQGGSLPNAHLLSLFSRLCKLLFYRIRPIIVFDGGFPELKKQTIINRQNRRAAVKQSSRDIGMKILTNYVASQNLGKGSGETNSKNIIKPKENRREEIYQLPPLPEPIQQGFSESAEDLVEWKFTNFSKEDIKYLNKIDIESDDFNDLPPDVKQEILSTLKESRRHRTWEQSQELPEDSDEFSNFQLQGLLKKRNLSRKLEQVQKDLRQISAADFVAQYTSDHVLGETNKIMSDDCSHYVLLKKIMKSADSTSKSEDSGEASSSMMDTKNAFIKDLENIDVVDDFFDEKPKNLCSKIDKNVVDNFDNFSEEDVDNPPEACQVTSVKKELSFEKASSSIDSRVVLSSDDEEDIQLLNDKNNRQSDIKVSEPIQSSEKSSQSLANVFPLSYPDLNESYLETDFVAVSSSDDEMIPCDEIPAESLLSQPCYNPQTVEVPNLFSEKKVCSKIDSVQTDDITGVSDVNFNNDSKNSPTKRNILNSNLSNNIPTIEKPETSDKGSIPASILSPTSIIKPTSSIQTTTSKGSILSEPSASSVSSTLCVSSTQSASSVSSTSNMPSMSAPPFSSTPFNSAPSTSALPSTSREEPEELSPETIQRNLELREELDAANLLLEADQAKLDRQNRTVQDHMIEDCKELLRLFGIPFVVSPTEAEAQCAFYDLANLSHGTITDDSDVWLFGGKRVYKNFFTQQKYVEFFKDHEIFTHFGLSRKKLINFALLTGSDYTEGIEGVGRVTAMEILSEFPGDNIDALCKFKDWWTKCNKHAHPPENKVRAKLLKLVLGESFPDEKVFEAYLKPEIDESTEKFTWGRPDLDALRDYTKEKFGWNKTKVDEQLLPVIKKLGERDSQTHLDSFFTVSLKKQTELFPSKRMMSAVKKITSPQKDAYPPPTKPNKRRSKAAVKKTVQRKAVCRTKQSKPQGPVLSEESSDES